MEGETVIEIALARGEIYEDSAFEQYFSDIPNQDEDNYLRLMNKSVEAE